MENRIKDLFLSAGADVCGIGSMDRFSDCEPGFSPLDIYPGCKSVIAIGIALPKGVFSAADRLVYTRYNTLSTDMLDLIALKSAKLAEKEFGAVFVPLPCDSPYDYWEADALKGKGMISMKYAAVKCGLGSVGKNSLLINPEFGNRLTVGAVLTELELEPDPIMEELCIPECKKCIEACPVGAINESRQVEQSLCRIHAYGSNARGFDTVDCKRCREACPYSLK